MKRRIFLNMILLTSITLILVSTMLCIVFYRQFSSSAIENLRNRAETFIDNTSQTAIDALAITKGSDMRVTVVMPDGTVVFDNIAQTDQMPNHLDRDEICSALETGYGQSVRVSDTLGKETNYYAVRLTDGYVLRVAKTSSGVLGVFAGIFPIAACVVFIIVTVGYLLAGRLTKRIVAPLGVINLSGELTSPYDELTPFIKTIAEQREHIAGQLSDLQSRSDTISAIMRNMNEGIILINTQGVILSANASVLRLFEKDPPVEGTNVLEILRDDNFSARVSEALSGARAEMLMELWGRTYRVYFSHVKGGGAIILFLDITEKAEGERLRREFSANVSHELKTPLTSIYAGAEMLYSGIVKDSDKQTFYGQIKDEAGRLIDLIDDILMISKLDEGAGQQSFEPVGLKAAAIEATESLARKAAENSVTVTVCGENLNMKASRSLIYEMLYNLIDNAIKYNTPGGSVVVEITSLDTGVKISVSDTGIGIPKESQSRVFERFYRVDKSRSKKTGGTGLGLAIVKHIVMVHNGKIELASRAGEGTSVTVIFTTDNVNNTIDKRVPIC